MTAAVTVSPTLAFMSRRDAGSSGSPPPVTNTFRWIRSRNSPTTTYFSAGPIARQLSATFDEYWNSGLAIPVKALGSSGIKADDLAQHRMAGRRSQEMQPLESPGLDYVARIATGEPYAGMLSGRLPLIWAPAIVICDSPHKQKVASGAVTGRLMEQAVAAAARGVKSELLMVTPYFVPSADEMQLLTDLRARQVKVRVLTNSLESTPDLLAQSGYMEFRVSLLNQGSRPARGTRTSR